MAIGELPDEFADQRRALEAFELYAVAFGAEVPNAAARLAAVRGGELADGVGARMLAAVAAWDWALRGGRRTPVPSWLPRRSPMGRWSRPIPGS